MDGISIIVTYYKGEKFIFNCINSIIESYTKSQKRFMYEIVLVIDSMEDSGYISDKIKVEYGFLNDALKVIVNAQNIGVARSRNVGLTHSKYRYFTIIDQDDYIEAPYFSTIEKQINGSFALYLINGYIRYTNLDKSIPIYFFKPRFDFKSILLKNTYVYTPGQVIFDSGILAKSDFFIDVSDKYKGTDDWAAYLGFLLKHKNIKYKYIREKLFVYCLHSENYSNNICENINASQCVISYLSDLVGEDTKFKNYLNFAHNMHAFYYSKDCKKLNKIELTVKHTKEFLWHYLFSFFNLDRQNRLIFNIRKVIY